MAQSELTPVSGRMWMVTLSYDGTDYRGWQVQPGERTIQGELQEALGRVTGETPLPQGSGRTDAGVHALAQVASFELRAPIPAENLHRALNRTLPPSIRILDARTMPDEFHARHSAVTKIYEYRVWIEKRECVDICPPFVARYVLCMPLGSGSRGTGFRGAEIFGGARFCEFCRDRSRSDDTKGQKCGRGGAGRGRHSLDGAHDSCLGMA